MKDKTSQKAKKPARPAKRRTAPAFFPPAPKVSPLLILTDRAAWRAERLADLMERSWRDYRLEPYHRSPSQEDLGTRLQRLLKTQDIEAWNRAANILFVRNQSRPATERARFVLRDIRLEKYEIPSLTLAHLDLRNAVVINCSIRDCDVTGLMMDGARCQNFQLYQGQYHGTGPSFVGADLTKSSFHDLKSIGRVKEPVNFSRAILLGANIRGCDLTGAVFSYAKMGSRRQTAAAGETSEYWTNLTRVGACILIGAVGMPAYARQNCEQCQWVLGKAATAQPAKQEGDIGAQPPALQAEFAANAALASETLHVDNDPSKVVTLDAHRPKAAPGS